MASSTRFQFLDKTWSYLGYDTSNAVDKSADGKTSLPNLERRSSPSLSEASTTSTSSSSSFQTAPATPELSTLVARARVSSSSPSPLPLSLSIERDDNFETVFHKLASDQQNDGNGLSSGAFSHTGSSRLTASSVIRPMKRASQSQPSSSGTSRRQVGREPSNARRASSIPALRPQSAGITQTYSRALSLPNSHEQSSPPPSPPPIAPRPSPYDQASCLSSISSNHHPSTSSARLTGSTAGTSISDLLSDIASTFGLIEPRPSQHLPAIPLVIQTQDAQHLQADVGPRRSPSAPPSPERTPYSEPSAHLRRAIQKCRRGVKSFSYAKWLAKKMGTPLDIEVRTKHMRAYERKEWQEYKTHTRTELFEEIDVRERKEARNEDKADETQDDNGRTRGTKHPRRHDEQINEDEGRIMIDTPVTPAHEHEKRPPRKKLKKHNRKESGNCRFAPSAPA